MLTEVFTPNMINKVQSESNVLTAGAANLRLPVQPDSILRLVNGHATQTVHINFGDGNETAVSAQDMIVPPAFGVLQVKVPGQAVSMSYIASGANTPLYFTKGA